MPFEETRPDNQIFYRHWTTDNPNAVIILLHGFGEHTGHYHRLAAELTRTGADVWSPDHHGHGLSGAHDGMFDSLDQLVDDADVVLGLARRQAPRLPVFVVGHSLGALVAALLTDRHADLIAGLVMTGAPIAGAPASLPDTLTFSLDPSYLDDLEHDTLGFESAAAEENLWRQIAACLPRLTAVGETLPTPTLLIYGQHDVFTAMPDARQWTCRMKRGSMTEIEGGYHDIVNDVAHRRVAARITEFIAAHNTHRFAAGVPAPATVPSNP